MSTDSSIGGDLLVECAKLDLEVLPIFFFRSRFPYFVMFCLVCLLHF